jgi:uncharacterized protein (TIGR03437 family)
VLRIWILAALCLGHAWGQAPSYTAAGIVKDGNWAAGPFAPNSIVTIFGSRLARSEHTLTAADIKNNSLPLELNYTRVYLDNSPVPLFYVSEGQINFLVPGRRAIGKSVLWVAREGWAGPQIPIDIVDAAPGLFALSSGFAIASHRDFTLVSPDSPAHPGETVVLWATGLGKTRQNPSDGELPPYVSPIVLLENLRVLVNGVAVDPAAIVYAGLSPGWAGLYQINFTLPEKVAEDPELRVSIGDQSTPAGLKIAVR